jgi:hypothetical protein
MGRNTDCPEPSRRARGAPASPKIDMSRVSNLGPKLVPRSISSESVFSILVVISHSDLLEVKLQSDLRFCKRHISTQAMGSNTCYTEGKIGDK